MQQTTALLSTLIEAVIGWINKLFGFANVGVVNFPKLIMYAFLLVAASKVFKIKGNFNLGKK